MLIMKKLPGLLLLILIALQPGCKKTNDTLAETNAHVRYGGDPAADGIGYYIRVDNTQEYVIPINLPSGYQKTDVNAAVAVKFVDTGKKYFTGLSTPANPGIRVVYIVMIRKL